MCRFTVRAPHAGNPAATHTLEPKLEAPLDIASIFEDDADDLDASDLALLALLNIPNPASGQPQPAQPIFAAGDAPNAGLVIGQALCLPQGPAPTLGLSPPPMAVPVPTPDSSAVQQLQLQAVMQHQAAIMQNPQAFPAAAQIYQQALLQQQACGMPPAVGRGMPVPTAPVGNKRSNSNEAIEDQTERVKKRRRESAQRSRQRKSAYMKGLEMENRALRMENERLRGELSKSGATTANVALLPKASCGSVSRYDSAACSVQPQEGAGSDHVSLFDDGEGGMGMEGLCGQLGLPGAADPLTQLMPSADLLNFAF